MKAKSIKGKSTEEIKKALVKSMADGYQPTLAIVFISISFGVVMKEEIEHVHKIWDVPMAGFFSYGEYGKSKTGKYEYHNNTCCLLVLKEK